ncbi:MAG: hypothetical protein SFW66_01305 [Gammaproteobacteria bacterium]|nr:hypothetical protein [Gammaproteobacteria bacterium]
MYLTTTPNKHRCNKSILEGAQVFDETLNQLVDILSMESIFNHMALQITPEFNTLGEFLKEMMNKGQVIQYGCGVHINLDRDWSIDEFRELESQCYEIHLMMKNSNHHPLKSYTAKLAQLLFKMCSNIYGSFWLFRSEYMSIANKFSPSRRDKTSSNKNKFFSPIENKNPIDELQQKIRQLEIENIDLRNRIVKLETHVQSNIAMCSSFSSVT